MKRLTRKEWMKEGYSIFVKESSMRDWKFKCPSCETPQSMNDLLQYVSKEYAQSYIAFSCIGRVNGTLKAKKPIGCDWTLGGLFRIHNLEVENCEEDNEGCGDYRMMFEFYEESK